jgi:hypothetical protein
MKRSQPMKRAGRIKPKPRTRSEFARIYGSKARVEWVKSLPCLICGRGPCDNAHTENGGMGRKGDAASIVPLCCMGMDDPHSPGYLRGHHGLLHQIGVATFESEYRVDLKAEAARVAAAWNQKVAA